MLLMKIVGALIFSYVFVSFVEYQIHRHLMHRKRLPEWVYRKSAYFLETFEAHAIRHHRTWYKEFDHEPDPHGREENLDIKFAETLFVLVAFSPILGTFIWLSPLGGSIVFAVAFFHNRLWNLLHREMHIPEDSFFGNWPIFHYLARHHFMHHQQIGKNYNVVFPLWDYLLSTKARPKLSDVRELLRLGYIRPRQAGTRLLVNRWCEETTLQRAA